MLTSLKHEAGKPMRIEQIPVPEVRPTDVLVNVKACSIVPNLANSINNIHRFPYRDSLRSILAILAIFHHMNIVLKSKTA
jgi:alcohol dehydrogenase